MRFLVGLGLVVICGAYGADLSVLGSRQDGGTCRISEASRRAVVMDNGNTAYIAPNTFAMNRIGEMFLAGTPNYVFGQKVGREAILLGRDSILGVAISPAGTVRTIPTPLAMHLTTAVKASPREDGGWDVVFGEKETPSVDGPENPPGRIVQLWAGIFRDGEWASIEKLPFPESAEIKSLNANSVSELVRNGDRLAWAVAAMFPGAVQQDAVILERTASGWSYERVPTGTGIYLGLLYPDSSSTLLLTAIKPDSALIPGESDRNSLFVWTRHQAWGEQHRLVRGGVEGPVHRPAMSKAGTNVVVTWAAEVNGGYELRAFPRLFRSDTSVVIDQNLANAGAFNTVSSPHGPLWVLAPSTALIRFSGFSGVTGPSPYAEVANPFFARFRVLSNPEANALFLTGGTGVSESNSVVSIIIRYAMDCSSR